MGMGDNVPGPGYAAGATGLPFPINTPAPTGAGTGTGVSGMAGMLPICGADMPGPATGLYIGNDAGLGLPGSLGGITFVFARAAFRLRRNSKSPTMPPSNAPNIMATPPISSPWPGELEGAVPVFVPPLFPEFVPFVVGVWLFPTVGDTPAVGDALVAVTLAAVAVVVGVTLGVMVGEGVGDGRAVGEGDTTGAE